jgi:hypothetical protein
MDLSLFTNGPYVVKAFLVVFFLFYMFFVDRNVVRNFFIVITLAIIMYVIYVKYKKKSASEGIEDVYINKVESMIQDTVLNYDNIYQIHKAPRALKFVKRSRELKHLLYELRHYVLYDQEAYLKFVCLLEYFLKFHFLVISGKYDYTLYYPVIKDIRNNMINHLFSMYFNFPKYSTVKGVDDMDEYLYKRIKYVQAFTYRYMKILNNKFALAPLHAPPFGNDATRDNHYSIV